jgi:hypothetical protein
MTACVCSNGSLRAAGRRMSSIIRRRHLHQPVLAAGMGTTPAIRTGLRTISATFGLTAGAMAIEAGTTDFIPDEVGSVGVVDSVGADHRSGLRNFPTGRAVHMVVATAAEPVPG